ncbi:putative ribonuclease H protein [Glycine soja]
MYDSTLALHLIHNEVNEYHPYSPMVQLIDHLLALTWIVSFKHTLQEENACADWLAKYGAMHAESYKIWNVCPSQLSTLVMTDKMGAVHFRLSHVSKKDVVKSIILFQPRRRTTEA